jgi:hypothetical protein
MKASGKGQGISINPAYPNRVNRAEGFAVRLEMTLPEFKPLKVVPHPRQKEMDAYKDIPSRAP